MTRITHGERAGHAERRAAAYPPLGEQLDAILKALARMQEAGADIGPEAAALLVRIQAVKTRHPKP